MLLPERYKQYLPLRHRKYSCEQCIGVLISQTAQQKCEDGDCMDVLVYPQENERYSKC